MVDGLTLAGDATSSTSTSLRSKTRRGSAFAAGGGRAASELTVASTGPSLPAGIETPGVEGGAGGSTRAALAVVRTAVVVDDAVSNLRTIMHQLTKMGVRVVGQAADGEEALALYHASADARAASWFIDKNMPRMDGPTLIRTLRQCGFAGVAVGVTADALACDLDEFLASGLSTVLTKPMSPPKLQAALQLCNACLPPPTSAAVAAAQLAFQASSYGNDGSLSVGRGSGGGSGRDGGSGHFAVVLSGSGGGAGRRPIVTFTSAGGTSGDGSGSGVGGDGAEAK